MVLQSLRPFRSAIASLTSSQPPPIIYMIRHGEKPPKDDDGKDVDGLSAQGLDRAQGLVKVFGQASEYNIRYILAEHPKKATTPASLTSSLYVSPEADRLFTDGSRARPYDTVTPLSKELGIPIDDSISRNDTHGAAKAAKGYHGPGNILICWEHGELAKIAEALGVKGEVKYPDDRFDLIWTLPAPYKEIESVTSENIPGLDDGREET